MWKQGCPLVRQRVHITCYKFIVGLITYLTQKKSLYPYAGVFAKLYSLHEMDTKIDYVSAVGYICIGNRFKWRGYFLDLRLNQNIYAVRWSNLPGTKATSGFHPSIYKWKSSYIPYAGINIGYMFR